MPVMHYLTTCIFDHGALKQLPKVLKDQGGARPLVVSDPGLKAAGLIDRAIAALGHEPAAAFLDTPVNPTQAAAIKGAKLFKESGADSIIALGGGASMDMGKAIGFWATHQGPYERYGASQRGSRHIGKIPPLIAIPTTAGTGSEVSVGFVVILDSGRKETFVSPFLIPATAICDPDLTLGLPASVTAATGMDAVTHCIEAVLSAMVHPPAEGIGYDGLHRAVAEGWLKRAVADGGDREARFHMMMASYEGALAFVKGLGAVHGLSHALGRLQDLKLHHGTLNAIILPHSLAMIESADAAPGKLARLRFAMGLKEGADLAAAVADLNMAIGIPKGLSALGVTSAHLNESLDYAVSDLATASNAIPFGAADYEALFAASL
jgi:4-hydroxybutyrate dehydrogenase